MSSWQAMIFLVTVSLIFQRLAFAYSKAFGLLHKLTLCILLKQFYTSALCLVFAHAQLYLHTAACLYLQICIDVYTHIWVVLKCMAAPISIYFTFLLNSSSLCFLHPEVDHLHMCWRCLSVSQHYNTKVVKVHYLLIGLSNCLCYAPGPNSWQQQVVEALLKLLHWLPGTFYMLWAFCLKDLWLQLWTRAQRTPQGMPENQKNIRGFWSFLLLFQVLLREPPRPGSFPVVLENM